MTDDQAGRSDVQGGVWDERFIRERLQANYSMIIDGLCSADDIAAKLFERDHINAQQLETIQKKRCGSRKNEKLLSIVYRSSAAVDLFQSFMDALLETGQSDLYSCVSKGIIPPIEHRKVIQKHYRKLVHRIDPNSGLLDYLFQSKCLTSREVAAIQSKTTKHCMNEELLSLMIKKPSKCFPKFVEALETTNQSHIAKLLNSKYEICYQREIQRNQEFERHSTEVIDGGEVNLATNEGSLQTTAKETKTLGMVDISNPASNVCCSEAGNSEETIETSVENQIVDFGTDKTETDNERIARKKNAILETMNTLGGILLSPFHLVLNNTGFSPDCISCSSSYNTMLMLVTVILHWLIPWICANRKLGVNLERPVCNGIFKQSCCSNLIQ